MEIDFAIRHHQSNWTDFCYLCTDSAWMFGYVDSTRM